MTHVSDTLAAMREELVKNRDNVLTEADSCLSYAMEVHQYITDHDEKQAWKDKDSQDGPFLRFYSSTHRNSCPSGQSLGQDDSQAGQVGSRSQTELDAIVSDHLPRDLRHLWPVWGQPTALEHVFQAVAM